MPHAPQKGDSEEISATLLDALAGGSTSQHDIPGQFHMPVVLGELFVTLQQEMPLCPFLMLRPHRGGKRRGLIALDMGNVGLDFLFYKSYGVFLRQLPYAAYLQKTGVRRLT
jgi:hypothetical protein